MPDSPPKPFLYVAGSPYGGLAGVGFFRAVLDLRTACAQRDILLQLDLGGGEALASRGRAMQAGRFLKSLATHLLLSDAQSAFEPDAAIAAMSIHAGAATLQGAVLLAREQVVAALDSVAQARFADVRGAQAESTALLFESAIDPDSRVYRPAGLASWGLP